MVFETAKQRADWTFWIAGEPCYQSNLEKGILDLGDNHQMVALKDYPNVKLWGFANRKLRRRLLSRATVLMQMTQGFEPFGLNVIEAALSGVPVVASNHGTFPEIVKHGTTGYLVSREKKEIGDELDAAAKLSARDCVDHGLAFSTNAMIPYYESYLRTAVKNIGTSALK